MKNIIIYGFIKTFLLANQNSFISNTQVSKFIYNIFITFISCHIHLHLYLIGQQVCFLYTAVQPGIVKEH